MSEIKENLKYTKDHEWVRASDTPKIYRVGITDFAQSSLGDVTFLELPESGRHLKKGEIFGSVESVKAVSDLFSPFTGKVTTVNTELCDDPSPINSDPYGDAWMIELECENENEAEELLSPEAYKDIAE